MSQHDPIVIDDDMDLDQPVVGIASLGMPIFTGGSQPASRASTISTASSHTLAASSSDEDGVLDEKMDIDSAGRGPRPYSMNFQRGGPGHMPDQSNENRSRPYAVNFDRASSGEENDQENVPSPRSSATPSSRQSSRDDVDLDQLLQNRSRRVDDRNVIDLSDIEDELELLLEDETPIEDLPQLASTISINVSPPWVKLESFHLLDSTVKAGDTVEMQDGSFLFVADIIKNLQTDVVRVRGLRLVRCKSLKGLLRKGLNELCFIFQVVLDDMRSLEEQSMIEVELEDILRVRKLVRTNFPFPALRFAARGISDCHETNLDWVYHTKKLVVRWKQTTAYDTHAQQLLEGSTTYPLHVRYKKIEALEESDCDAKSFLPSDVLRHQWREDATDVGNEQIDHHKVLDEEHVVVSHHDEVSGCEVCDKCGEKFRDISVFFEHYHKHLNNDDRSRAAKGYTFGDCFCGGGGTTCGAAMAGFEVKYGLDKDPDSAYTWRKNFSSAKHHEMWADEFVRIPDPAHSCHVDVLHLSPPCQVWSPVKTVPGQNDQQNFDSLFACEELLKKGKPRFATLEQTFGILHPKFSFAFNTLIQMFTWRGYSVRWGIVQCQNYGLAQKRKRLIIIAACPGETLPELPPYTHSETPRRGQEPLTSVRSVLARIPRNAQNHDVSKMLAQNTRKAPWDAYGLATCIMTGGGEKGHPSGLRNFTHRELAAIQSFPHDFVFYGKAIRRQIGNAVPPMIAKIIFTAIKKHLEETDRVEKPREVIEID